VISRSNEERRVGLGEVLSNVVESSISLSSGGRRQPRSHEPPDRVLVLEDRGTEHNQMGRAVVVDPIQPLIDLRL